MTDAPIHQIEFRWDPDYDLTGIAWSFESRTQFESWNTRLKKHAGVSARGRSAAAEAPSSAVYLTYPDGMAALILRSVDPRAMSPGNAVSGAGRGAGADRLHLVARALIGLSTTLTADIAMLIAASDPRGIFSRLPGQVGRGSPLQPMSFSHLIGNAAAPEDLEERARRAPGLAALLAAVLEDPARPVTMVLPPEEIRGPVASSRALALLWASRRILKPLLTDADGRPLDGWRAAFSTCEAPLTGGDGRTEPAVAFRDRGLEGPPLHEGPREVRPGDPAAPQGDLSAAAGLLAEAYAAFGDDAARLVRPVVQGCATLQDKILAVACSKEITEAIDPGRVPDARQPARVPGRGARWSPVPAPEPVPAAAGPAVGPRPEPVRAPSVPVPPRGDRHLVRLYQLLRETTAPAGTARIVDWVAARTARGAVLDREGFSSVLHVMEGERWFADRVAGLPDGTARMAALMEPLFAASFGDDALEDRLRRAHANGGLAPVIADALGVLAARLEPDRADWLAERCLGYALAQRAEDRTAPAGPAPAPPQESVVAAALLLPGRWLPGTAVGFLVWTWPALLAVLVVLRLA
ncbi:hypothetical protein HUT06_33365 [Actinomadura sp. NAK00032]|uniref:hypothetical protein n=1 Tax=Actinomadura sp. NAK00032 TaxID=2742128 RepID=UPI0015921CE5|nr:hypothetical protein [Actinomadura sp. NAK00032]QKW38293.1 hypothetical protein HUT06_33365 [Actinomadura sp. NAK00032]